MNPLIRQGDVLIIPVHTSIQGAKLLHLTLAEGEVTGHRHRISSGEAELFDCDGVLYLKIVDYGEDYYPAIRQDPMVLLKMTCPSTAHVHILRVQPDMVSAEVAIKWVNHGIHPDEFTIQTRSKNADFFCSTNLINTRLCIII